MEKNINPAAGETAAEPPITVWLVDDNRQLRVLVKEILETRPEVRCTGSFPSPNAVLSALASKPGPDVILLDIQMKEACGLDAIRAIKSLARDTQVLMFTTFFDPEQERRARRDGASDFLLKSFPVTKIADAIQRAKKQPAPHLKRTAKPRRAETAPKPKAKSKRSTSWLKRLFRNR